MGDVDERFPFDVRKIDTSEAKELRKHFKGMISLSETRYGPNGYLLPPKFEKIGRDVYNMEIRPDDTFVITFPRSGTTWTQDMVWLIANNFDYETALKVPLNLRYPFVDMAMIVNPEAVSIQDETKKQMVDVFSAFTLDDISGMESPRFIKSHLPLSLLPPNLLDTCKVVYVARDPRDVAVSFYHYAKLMRMANEIEFNVYWNFFTKDLLPWTPYFSHIKEALKARYHPNMLFMFYEDLSKDLPACARRVAKFLGKQISDEQVKNLCEHLDINNFKRNKSVNRENIQALGLLDKKESFIRKGEVGGWRDYFNEEMAAQAERWIVKNLQDTDLQFPFI